MSSTDKQVPPLREIYLYLTGSCNLNCRHCWIDPAFEQETDKFLPWTELKKIIEGAIPLGLHSIKLTGGEPFMHPEIIEILYALKEMDLGIRMETNGTLITREGAKAIRETDTTISVSVDGPTAELHDNLRGVRGSFARVMKGIDILRSEGLRFEIITCLYRKNMNCLPAMIYFAKKLGARSLKINPISGIARSENMLTKGETLSIREVLEIYYTLERETTGSNEMRILFDIPPAFKSLKEIRKNGFCSCGLLNIIGVLYDGRGGLCGIGNHVHDLDFGNLLSLSIENIWKENEVLSTIRENIPRNLQGICGICIFKSYCFGKCVAQTFYEKKELLAGFSFCQEAFEKGLFPQSRLIEIDDSRLIESKLGK